MLLTILLAVFVVLSILILLKFFKHIFKALFLIGALLSIIVVVFGILVLLDLNDLRMNIGKQPSRIMYADGQNVLLAFSIDPVALQESQGSEILSGIESIPVSGLQDSYQKEDFKALRGEDYKLVVVNDSFFDLMQIEPIETESGTLDPLQLRALLRSGADTYKMGTVTTEVTPEMRNMAFMILLQSSISGGNVRYLFQGVRQGHIMIYPRTALVEALQFTPGGMVDVALASLPSLPSMGAKDTGMESGTKADSKT